MNLLNIFKKDKKVFKPLYETDFKAWANKCSVQELEEYVNKIGEGKEYDYTTMCWRHAFYTSSKCGDFIHYGNGFHGRIIGCPQPAVGSILLMKTGEEKVVRYMILNIEWVSDPDDMFWAYIVGIGFKD